MAKDSVTSEDVARRANVSQSAVSRTFTPGASVSERTRQRVLEAARELGYRPNALARAMISGRSRLIAVLVAYLDNHFYPMVLEQLSRAVQEQGYQVLLFMTERGTQDQMVQKMLQYQVEGIVMASADMSSSLARECAETGIPVVLFNRYVTSSLSSSVTSDNVGGARRITEVLIAAGHRRIAYIAGTEDSSTNQDRESGFLQAMERGGLLPFRRAVGSYTASGAAVATRKLFEGDERPDAIVVANDHMAFAVMDVVRDELGLHIPRDVSIVGFDDVPEAAWAGYGLTTVRQSADCMIVETVKILFDQIEKGEVVRRAVIVPASLSIRRSARLPAPDVLARIAEGG